MNALRTIAMGERADNTTIQRLSLIAAMMTVVVAVSGMSLYANAPLLMTTRPNFEYFPPFERNNNQNQIQHLGAEYNAIAKALLKGHGFADPFRAPTGPTAWMPPVFSWLLAGIHWYADGDITIVKTTVVILQDLTLIATGWLVIGLARRTNCSVWLATVLFIGALTYYFRQSFQFTHDCCIVLAVIDVLVAGMVWVRPFQASWPVAAGWGVTGGLIALTSPAVAFIWGLFALAEGWRKGQRLAFSVAVLAAGLTVAPWVARNYQVFGRFIPIKSNLAFELYQSQCVQEGGVLHNGIWETHPNAGGNSALFEYARLGEMQYMDRKMEQFQEAVRANPTDFLERVWNRFLEATLVYVPFNKEDERRRPWMTWYAQLVYPLPFVSMVGLLISAPWCRLRREQWIVIGVYIAYMTPYIIVSYYERYKFPMMGTETILLVWGIHRFLNLGAEAKPQAASLAERIA